MRNVRAVDLGRIEYDRAHELQVKLLEERIRGEIPDTLLVVEHPPVITLGRGADRANVTASAQSLAERGIDVVETGRGGDVTYHGPGQLVVYPILDLKPDRCDVRRYVGDLARVMTRVAASYGIGAHVFPPTDKKIGIWVDLDNPAEWREHSAEEAPRRIAKLGAIGVRLSRWVTMHGFAFNVATALDAFELIVPCGIREHGVTSLHALGRSDATLAECARRAVTAFAEIFDADISWEKP